MIVLILLAFVGMLTGIFLILGMTPFTFAEELTKPLSGRRQPISKRIQQVNHPKEPKGIRKTVLEAREMLILTGKGGKFAAICAFSLFLAAMGAVICIVIQNYFMLPVLAVGMGLLPFWYVLFTSHSYKKLMNNEIETGLSIITSSYLRSESMITAVEENIHYLNPPVADVFRGFLAETNMISADVKQALSNMKPKLDNYVFREWVDAAIACQDDKSLKSTLTPIIGKLSDMRIVAADRRLVRLVDLAERIERVARPHRVHVITFARDGDDALRFSGLSLGRPRDQQTADQPQRYFFHRVSVNYHLQR